MLSCIGSLGARKHLSWAYLRLAQREARDLPWLVLLDELFIRSARIHRLPGALFVTQGRHVSVAPQHSRGRIA